MTPRLSLRLCLVTGVAALAGCGTHAAQPSTHSPDWTEPASYEYTLDSRCGERYLIGKLTLTVAGGKVARASGLDEAGQRLAEDVSRLPTLGQLLDEYETAKPEADSAAVEFDSADGHPTRIDIDPERRSIDDEVCYQITAYRVLS